MKTRLALLVLYPLLLLGLAIASLRYLFAVVGNTDKAWNIAIMIDELSNVDANGRVNQTISARAAIARKFGRSWGCVLCRVLDAIQTNHCTNALKDTGS